jgi:hypothetical protein
LGILCKQNNIHEIRLDDRDSSQTERRIGVKKSLIFKRRRSLSPAELAEEVYEATEIFSSETMLRSSSTIPSDPVQVLLYLNRLG